jgi:protein-tyrosine phosphatase
MDQTLRTSHSHPLRIAEIQVGTCAGLIGITFCPGKCGDSLYGAGWKRDLATDLDVIRNWGAQAVVTLVEVHELEMLQVQELGVHVRKRGMEWHHLPIVDVQPPGPDFEQDWARVGPALGTALAAGGRVLVHCRGGLGRAGTVAALLLVASGETPEAAIRRVRTARPGAIETRAQEAYVHSWNHADPSRRERRL